MKLTDKACKNAQPHEKPRKMADGKGLYLEVRPNGGKYWRFKYRIGGKEKRISLGVYPETSLKEARIACDEARKQVIQGNDPSFLRQEAKSQQILDATNSFESVAREWFSMQQAKWSPKHAAKIINWLEKDVFPYLGAMQINEIKPKKMLETIKRIESRGALDVAKRILHVCNQVFKYAVIFERIEYNPAADLHGALQAAPPVKHRAHLAESELPEFLNLLEDYEGEEQTKLALKLKLLTLLRTSELRAGTWDEIDWSKREWHIPAERMKMKRPHVVPLTNQALAILDQLRKMNGNRKHIFPNHQKPVTYISENTMLFAMYRMGYHSRATPHGFRSTASTIMNEKGFRSDIIEAQLSHVENNKSRAAYNKAEYLDDRHEMMQWWADYLDKLGQNVNE